jgi:hypothetical protein
MIQRNDKKENKTGRKERKDEEKQITTRKVIKKNTYHSCFIEPKTDNSLPQKAQLREHRETSKWTTSSHEHVLRRTWPSF